MSDPLTNDELEAMKNGFYASRLFDDADGRTIVTWTQGLACALPKADVIVFAVPQNAWRETGLGNPDHLSENIYALIPVRWKEVVQLLGERWEQRFNRFCVKPEDFPSPEELAALLKQMVNLSPHRNPLETARLSN